MPLKSNYFVHLPGDKPWYLSYDTHNNEYFMTDFTALSQGFVTKAAAKRRIAIIHSLKIENDPRVKSIDLDVITQLKVAPYDNEY